MAVRHTQDALATMMARLLAPTFARSAVGLLLLPLVWWGPFTVAIPVTIACVFLLAASAATDTRVVASAARGDGTLRGTIAVFAIGAVILLMWDADTTTRALFGSIVISRTVLLLRGSHGSRKWLVGAHVVASVLSLMALGIAAALLVLALGVAGLLLDLLVATQTFAATAATEVPARADDNEAAESHVRPHATAEPDGPAPNDNAEQKSAAENVNAAVPEEDATTAAAECAEGATDITAAAEPKQSGVGRALTLAAALAAGFAIFFFAPLMLTKQIDSAETPTEQWQAEIEAEWRERFPWLYAPGAREQAAIPAPTGVCAEAELHEQRELHVLLEPLHPEDATEFRSIPDQFPRPPLALADAASADAVFGAPCANSPNLRQIQGRMLTPAPGVDVAIDDGPVAIGAAYTFSNAPGTLLLARASTSAGYVLIAAKRFGDETRIWIVSTQGSAGYGGRLFMVGRDEAETPLLWYGALDGEGGSTDVDVIDVSALTPRNSGAIKVSGASRCGQTLGEYLMPAEPNCAERPAWAFWLVDAHYTSPARNEVDVVWNLRRQFGVAGEPARYEPAFDTLMQGTYVRDDAGWRLVRVTNPEVAGLGDQLAMAN